MREFASRTVQRRPALDNARQAAAEAAPDPITRTLLIMYGSGARARSGGEATGHGSFNRLVWTLDRTPCMASFYSLAFGTAAETGSTFSTLLKMDPADKLQLLRSD
jgi:hypothetical protein